MVKRLEHWILKYMGSIFIDFKLDILEKRQKVFFNLLLIDCWSLLD